LTTFTNPDIDDLYGHLTGLTEGTGLGYNETHHNALVLCGTPRIV